MKQTKLFVLLVATLLVSSQTKAQVKIGGNADDPITPGAVLDLSSSTSGGLLLPQVTLTVADALPNEWIDIVENTDLLESGLMVYNLGGAGLESGVYIWQGTNGWALANAGGGSGPVPESITISADPAGHVVVDGTQTLTATVLPVNAGWTTVNWGGNNPSVAIVDQLEGSVNTATVTGIHNGITTVTASLDGVSSDPFTIQVGIPVQTITIAGPSNAASPANLSLGDTYQLTPTVLPDGASIKTVDWFSSDESVATVNSSGLVTTTSLVDNIGSTTITAKSTDGNHVTSNIFVVNVSDNTLYDSRDGQVYKTIEIDGVKWMAENLAYKPQATESGIAYTQSETAATTPAYCRPGGLTDDQVKNPIYAGGRIGYLYNWAAAMKVTDGASYANVDLVNQQGICPDGWHIPTRTEWKTMITYLNEHANQFSTANPGNNTWGSKDQNAANALISTVTSVGFGTYGLPGVSFAAGHGMNMLLVGQSSSPETIDKAMVAQSAVYITASSSNGTYMYPAYIYGNGQHAVQVDTTGCCWNYKYFRRSVRCAK
ncbi:MAG: Ig-like domain-containing protein [Candidatus Symbiothrix sp.]|jgi:uncharacterized protein (TIGR02145 family)|nr:Ig-like domain-containing protein [Candidatus Symbiothrix sp.]